MTKFELQTSNEFTLPDGRKVGLKAVSIARVRASQNKARKELEAQGIPMSPPTYPIPGVVTAPGVEIPTQEYDEKTILDAPEEVQKEFIAYQLGQRQLQNLTAAYMLVTLLLRGTEYEMPDDSWWKEAAEDGMDVPENPEERYLFYMVNEVLMPPVMAQECAKDVLRLSLEGADPKVIEAFEDSFRNPIQNQGREDARAGKNGAKKRPVVVQRPVRKGRVR